MNFGLDKPLTGAIVALAAMAVLLFLAFTRF